MQAPDLFGVFVRVGGLGMIVVMGFDLFHVLLRLLGISYQETPPMAALLVGAGGWLFFGIALLGGADKIVRIAYGDNEPQQNRGSN